MMNRLLIVVVAAISLAGCKTSYTWTSDVPARLRTICVPVFRNESDVTELGSLAALQTLRELQREGTFKIAGPDDAAVEVQGVIKQASATFTSGDRKTSNRLSDFSYTMVAEVSVVDRVNGRVLVDNKIYVANTSFMSGQDDSMTAQRNASGRLAEDLARQIVDDVLAVQW